MVFEFRWQDDDVVHVLLDGHYIFSVDYDTLGRAGMNHMLEGIRIIADIFSAEVHEVWPEDEDE